MRTKGEAIIGKVNDSILNIVNLLSISYTEEDYSEIVKSLGGEIEKFIKSTVLNLPNKNFNELIEELINHSISQDSIDSLHDFRQCYNKYKHEPNYSKDIFQIKSILEKLKDSLVEINGKALGNVNNPYFKKSNRVVWFAGWDDYIGGMTECGLFIPDYNIDMPLGIEHFNIDWKAWDKIVKQFSDSGDLFMGKEYVSDKAYEFWKAQSDFLNAGTFKGDVSEFVKELSKNIARNENDLIPFLKRDHDSYSVFSSIVFSIFDSLRENNWSNKEDLKDEILLRMTYDYGIDLKSPYLKYINHIDWLILESNRDLLKCSNDILWLDELVYKRNLIGVISDKLQIGFNKDYSIITKIK